MPTTTRPFPATAIGWLLALIGLILTVVFWAAGSLLVESHCVILFILAFLAILL